MRVVVEILHKSFHPFKSPTLFFFFFQENNGRDFIDAYLIEQAKGEKKSFQGRRISTSKSGQLTKAN